MSAKTFHLSALLSVLPVDVFCCQDGLQGVYDLLDHLTGDKLMQHQVPLAAEAMEAELVQQFPWLKDVTKPEPRLESEAECITWVASLADTYGEWHEVTPAPLAWGTHDPLADFRNQAPDVQVIPVYLDGES